GRVQQADLGDLHEVLERLAATGVSACQVQHERMALARDDGLELSLREAVGERGGDPFVALPTVGRGVGLGRHGATNPNRKPMLGPSSVIDSFATSASVSMTIQENASMFGPIGH